MSQVSQAFQSLAGSLRGGMKDVGQAHLQGVQMDLMEAQQEAELGDPRRLLEMEEAQAKLQKKSMPYNINTVAGGDISAFENLIALPNKDDPDTSVVDLFPRSLGFTEMRVDEDGSVRYYKPGTNEFCNMLHMEANQETFNKIIAANFNRFKHYRAKLEADPNDIDAKDFLSNPARQVTELAQDAQKLMTWGMEGAANGVYKLIGVIQKNMEVGAKGKHKVGDTRKVQKGSAIITEEWTGDEWKEIGKGPKWSSEEKGVSPSQQLNKKKVEAWDAYYEGKATREQKQLIGVDTDAYLMRAAQMVASDLDALTLTAEEKAQKTIEIAETMRQAAEAESKKQDFLATATNPKTGEQLGFDGKKWVPIRK